MNSQSTNTDFIVQIIILLSSYYFLINNRTCVEWHKYQRQTIFENDLYYFCCNQESIKFFHFIIPNIGKPHFSLCWFYQHTTVPKICSLPARSLDHPLNKLRFKLF
jgi:hypothetical protein